jgi:HSP20 family protein
MSDVAEAKKSTIRPLCNICEEDGKVILRLEMPGVDKDNLDIKIDNDQLFIEGKLAKEEVSGEYILRERRETDYFQKFTLDQTVDRNKIDASMEKGILSVTLHLKDEVKPRKIEVKSD